MPLILTQWTSRCSKNNKSPCILPKYNPFHHSSSKCLKTSGFSSNTQPSRRKSRPLGRARSEGRIMPSLTNRSLHKCSRQLLSKWKVPNSPIRANLGWRTNRNYAGKEVWLRLQESWNSLRMVLISNQLIILFRARMLLERGFMLRVSARRNRVKLFSASQARHLSYYLQSTRRTRWAKASEVRMTPGTPLPTPQPKGNTWSESLPRAWSSSIRNLFPGNSIGLVWTKITVPS